MSLSLPSTPRVCAYLLIFGGISPGCIVDRQLGQPELDGGGEGSTTDETNEDASDSMLDPSSTDADDSVDSGGSGEAESDCEDVFLTAPFSNEWFDLDRSAFFVDIAPVTGEEPNLVFATSDWISVWPSDHEQWDDGEGAVMTQGGLPAFLQGMTLGDVTGTDDIDVVLLDNGNFVEIWTGDGSGEFTVHTSMSLMGAQSSFNGILVTDIDFDDRDEIIAGMNGGDLRIIQDYEGEIVITTIPTEFQGIDALHVAPWPGPTDPLHFFLGGYDLDGGANLNLAWAQIGGMEPEWYRAQGPFIHLGDLHVRYRDGAPLWVGIEGHPSGFGNLAVTPDPSDFESWNSVSLNDATTSSAVEYVGYEGGFDYAATIGGTTALVDIDCGIPWTLPGPGIEAELHVADLDGNGSRDLVGRSGTGFAVYFSGE